MGEFSVHATHVIIRVLCITCRRNFTADVKVNIDKKIKYIQQCWKISSYCLFNFSVSEQFQNYQPRLILQLGFKIRFALRMFLCTQQE